MRINVEIKHGWLWCKQVLIYNSTVSRDMYASNRKKFEKFTSSRNVAREIRNKYRNKMTPIKGMPLNGGHRWKSGKNQKNLMKI